jgi:tRNA 2-thiouridine synthesizing protein B
MPDLFTINKSPFEKPSLQSALRFAPAQSVFLLLEDGVYAATVGTPWVALIEQHPDKQFYVLIEDLQARGLQHVSLIDCMQTINYAGFVDLVINCKKTHAWL